MPRIPTPQKRSINQIKPINNHSNVEAQKILFSFEILDRNEYFNLDGTCANWASELIDTFKKLSKITLKDINSGKYSSESSTFGIHNLANAHPPCPLPANISLEDCREIRVSVNKGRIHGKFVENVFYILWLDPQHNLYPSRARGGIKKIIPPSNCCKDRDDLLDKYAQENESLKQELALYKEVYG